MVERSFLRLQRSRLSAAALIGITALALGSATVSAEATSDAGDADAFPILNVDSSVQAFVLYKQNCSSCHDHASGPIPDRKTIGGYSKQRVYDALTKGPMQAMAAALDDQQKRLLAAFIPMGPPMPEPALSANQCGRVGARSDKSGDWPAWSVDPTNTRFQPNGGLTAADVPRLTLSWAFAYPGGVGSLPVIADGRLYTASATGYVFALDARTGCTYWTAKVASEVRGAPVVVKSNRTTSVVIADGAGEVSSFAADDGRLRWTRRIFDDNLHRISGSPVAYAGRIYVPVAGFESATAADPRHECCRARGGLVALDAVTGDPIWRASTIAEPLQATGKNSIGTQNYGPAGASVWSAPTIDAKRGLIYVTSGNAYTEPVPDGADALIAFDLKTGERRWASQTIAGDAWLAGCGPHPHANCPQHVGPDSDLGMPAALATLPNGKQLLVAGSKGGVVYAFDPDDHGNIVWKTRLAAPNPNGSLVMGGAVVDNTVYLPVSYNQPEGGLAALDLATGKLHWFAPPVIAPCAWGGDFCSPAQRSPLTAIPGIVFSGSNDGHIRAYSTVDGKVVWSFDLGKRVSAVNGVEAYGGSMGRGGQIVVGGRLYINAGAGIGPSGNALMVFSVEGAAR